MNYFILISSIYSLLNFVQSENTLTQSENVANSKDETPFIPHLVPTNSTGHVQIEPIDGNSIITKCPNYSKVERCINFDRIKTTCWWSHKDLDSTNAFANGSNDPETFKSCQMKMNYTLFFVKQSSTRDESGKLPIQVCKQGNQARDGNLGEDENGSLSPSCSIPYLATEVTHEFFVAAWNDDITRIQKPDNKKLIYTFQGREHLKITYPPTNVKAESRLNGDVKVSWDPPDHIIYKYGLVEILYQIKYRKHITRIEAALNPDKKDAEWTQQEVPPEQHTQYIIRGLSRGSSYEFVVEARAALNSIKIWSKPSNDVVVYIQSDAKFTHDKDAINPNIEIATALPALTLDPELESKLGIEQVILLGGTGIITAALIISIILVCKKRKELKNLVISDIPRPNILVAIGSDDRGVNPHGGRRDDYSGGNISEGNGTGYSSRPMGLLTQAINSPAPVAVNLVSSRAGTGNNTGMLSSVNSNRRGSGTPNRARAVGSGNEQQWDTLRSPLVAKPASQVGGNRHNELELGSKTSHTTYDSGSGYPAHNGSGGGVYPRIVGSIVIPGHTNSGGATVPASIPLTVPSSRYSVNTHQSSGGGTHHHGSSLHGSSHLGTTSHASHILHHTPTATSVLKVHMGDLSPSVMRNVFETMLQRKDFKTKEHEDHPHFSIHAGGSSSGFNESVSVASSSAAVLIGSRNITREVCTDDEEIREISTHSEEELDDLSITERDGPCRRSVEDLELIYPEHEIVEQVDARVDPVERSASMHDEGKDEITPLPDSSQRVENVINNIRETSGMNSSSILFNQLFPHHQNLTAMTSTSTTTSGTNSSSEDLRIDPTAVRSHDSTAHVIRKSITSNQHPQLNIRMSNSSMDSGFFPDRGLIGRRGSYRDNNAVSSPPIAQGRITNSSPTPRDEDGIFKSVCENIPEVNSGSSIHTQVASGTSTTASAVSVKTVLSNDYIAQGKLLLEKIRFKKS